MPGPGRILSPAGTRLQLNCSVIEGYIVLRWEIQLPDLPDGSDSVETDRARAKALMEHGITFQNLSTPVSELIFKDERNSHSIAARDNTLIRFSSDQAEVII